MKNIRRFLSRFQLQYRRTSALNKVAIAAAVVLSSVTLVSLRLAQWGAQEDLAMLQHRAAELRRENQALRDDIDELGTAESTREIAQRELGLVDPDTIIIEDAN